MQVEVKDLLACRLPVSRPHVEPLRPDNLYEPATQITRNSEQVPGQFWRATRHIHHMPPGNDQGVTLLNRIQIQEREGILIIVDDTGGTPTRDDVAEHAVHDRRPVSTSTTRSTSS